MAVTRASAKVSKELSKEVVGLFRRVCRASPRLCVMYELPMTPSDLRSQVNVLFREHRNATDPKLVEMLLQKAEMEFEEALEQWKQKPHILSMLSADLAQAQFVDREAEDDVRFDGEDDDYLERLLAEGQALGGEGE